MQLTVTGDGRLAVDLRLKRLGFPLLALALVLSAVLAGSAPPAEAETGPQNQPVEGSIQQIYHPGSETEPSTPIKGYRGPQLTLQAVKVGKHAAEPTIGVTKDGTAFYAAGELVIDTNFAWGLIATDIMRSADGGLTWESVQARIPGAELSLPPANGDPFVWVDPYTDRIFNIDLYAGCSWLNYSDDKGDSWGASPAACGNYINDHQTIGAGPVPEGSGLSTSGYPNIVYYCFNRVVDANCGRSLDGGLTWTPTPQPSFFGVDESTGTRCGGLHGHIEVDPAGRVIVPKGHCGHPWVSVTEDAGTTWNRVQVSDIEVSQPHLAVASDATGNLYFVYWDSEKRLPYLSISRDHGKTWDAPMMIAPPGVTEVNFPVIAAGKKGRIAINFPGSSDEDRNGGDRPWNQYIVVSANALAKNPVFLSATANDPADPVHRGNCNGRCNGMWDFLDIVISANGEAWASASDDCVALCVQGPAPALHNGEGIAIRMIGGPRLR